MFCAPKSATTSWVPSGVTAKPRICPEGEDRGRLDDVPEKSACQIENVDVVDVAEIKPLTGLVVDNEFIEGGFDVEILALQILKRFRGGNRAGGRGDGYVGFARRSGGRLQGDAFEGKGYVESKPRDGPMAAKFWTCCTAAVAPAIFTVSFVGSLPKP
jgi:hypothetical protein